MYANGKGAGVIGSTIVTGTGAVVLPATAGNSVGTILAYGALSIGATALISQIVVRIIRRKYNA